MSFGNRVAANGGFLFVRFVRWASYVYFPQKYKFFLIWTNLLIFSDTLFLCCLRAFMIMEFALSSTVVSGLARYI